MPSGRKARQDIIKSMALLDTELALLREASEKRSKELEESLSIIKLTCMQPESASM